MSNPFDDPDGRFVVLCNEEEQYSLWPTFAGIPDGWTVAYTEHSRQECLDFVEATWTDLRPASLRREMGVTP
ncbi:MbtH family protein [Actinophytocola sp.]|uniref:MbtH family protein n=1 Tax=Actinophytocola sp. TaxID=1872138 RepID=UPI003D6A6C28